MTTSRIEAIDDCLGSSRGRFFGEGYKGVARRLTNIEVTPQSADPGVVRGSATLTYDANWSTKGPQGNLRPHLSTPDGLLMAANLVEAYMVHAYRLDAAERRRMWFSQFTFQAGNKPDEELSGFEVSAVHQDCVADPDSKLGYRSTFRARIGGLKITCTLQHERPRDARPAGRFAAVEDLLGPEEQRYYGVGYRARSMQVRDLELDIDSGRIHARVGSAPQLREPDGVEADYPMALSILEGMVALAQLAQVLIYQVDDLERTRSNTLWMRRATLTRLTPEEPQAFSANATVTIERANRLRLGAGTWRTFDVVGEIQGFVAHAALAHQLPEPAR
jgi:hypothetical protein